MHHPFADQIKLVIDEVTDNRSVCSITIAPDIHYNPHKVVHGAVLYALADTGMGAAIYPSLKAEESCATIEITMRYFKSAREGTIRCVTETLSRGSSIANLQSSLYLNDVLIAQASGNYAIFKRRASASV